MEYTKDTEGDVCRIKMYGKFTFSDHIEFKNIFEIINGDKFKNIEIDISGVEFVDSAALGLLLLVKEESEKKSMRLSILKPQGQVQKMFKISRFYELFNIID